MISEPSSEQELLSRAFELAGITLGELADKHQIPCPKNLKRDKGWVGKLLEISLGACAGSKPEQDFQHLGIELKTLPISYDGKPLETTFVCVAPLAGVQGLQWEKSHIRNKLSKVLWVPVEGEREIPISDRHIGTPMIWQPSVDEEAKLKADWEELMEFITLGNVHMITAKHGEFLQLRPKAVNSKAKTDGIGAKGQPIKTLPLGFYLRAQFTQMLLEKYFVLPR